ncbi:MAG: MoaD/ThiS family protein [Candidatus Thermoplasmatota archaeon]|nr:MoaD/ThiS family protein [Candidatus Thermoplasmatota archaeon]
MISHTVLLFGPLRDQFDARSMTVEMLENCSVNDVLNHIGVDSSIVKAAVNGTIVPPSTLLPEPSEIALLPPVSGG